MNTSDPVLQFAPFFGDEELASVAECFAANWVTEGPKSTAFVERLLRLTGAQHGVLAPNGTLALFLGLRALGIGPGDDVIVPDFTFFGSASAVEMTGATPVFCDIDPDTLHATPAHFDQVRTPSTRAIMPVHIYGACGPIDGLKVYARDHDLKMIEDAAQAVGVHFNGRHAGTFGDVGCFSFFADKTITTGEGGLVVTDDENSHDTLLALRNQGRRDRGSFVHPAIGYNFKLTDLQSAVGLVQLDRLDHIAAVKRGIDTRYRQALETLDRVRFVDHVPGSECIPFRTVIFADRAHDLMGFLQQHEIQTRTFFYPLHRQSAFAGLAAAGQDDVFPGACAAYDSGVCLPCHPSLPDHHVDRVCEAIHAFYAG